MKKTRNTKERILETGRELIWKHGYSHVTIDAICDETGIQKGSFYHFFENKAALAVVAFDALWEDYKPLLDRTFSTSTPPMKRLENYLRFLYQTQRELKEKHGRVMGCSFCLLAAELCQRDEMAGIKARAILGFYSKYLEKTLRDIQAEGLMKFKNIRSTVQRLCAFLEGCLLQARIRNDLGLLRNLTPGVISLISAGTVPIQNSKRQRRNANAETVQRLALAG